MTQQHYTTPVADPRTERAVCLHQLAEPFRAQWSPLGVDFHQNLALRCLEQGLPHACIPFTATFFIGNAACMEL